MLNYEARIPKYQESRNDVLWRYRRYGYYFGQVSLLLLVSFWVGPNLLLFRGLFSPSPATFVAIAQTPRYTEIVAAIKAYQRDKGALPFWIGDMPKAYIPSSYIDHGADLYGTTRLTFPIDNPSCVLVYEFSPASEGWIVYSPRYDGPIPAPIVPPGPATQPTSARPVTSGD